MNMNDEYKEAVSYLQSIPRFSADNKTPEEHFALTHRFYEYMDLPHPEKKVFHVAGTNGKGSVCAYLSSIHKKMGLSVAVFTSPHLTDIRERIVVDGSMISEEDFLLHYKKVSGMLEQFAIDTGYSPLFFDRIFFMAASYFAQKKPDAIIWETGLGGRLDATNAIPYKDVAVITEIGLDHMEVLGDTREKIATQKAGIITPGCSVVSVDRYPEVTGVIKSGAAAAGCEAVFVPGYEDTEKKVCDKRIDFSYNSRYYRNATFGVVGPAVYQTENASLAIAAMEAAYNDKVCGPKVIREGLLDMEWPGRFEEIYKDVYCDGAHNADGIAAMIESVRHDGYKGCRYLVFSAVSDKQTDVMLSMIISSGLFGSIGIVPITGSSRATDIEVLENLAIKAAKGVSDVRIETYESAETAVDKIREEMENGDVLYICGSLYLIGDIRAHMNTKGLRQ